MVIIHLDSMHHPEISCIVNILDDYFLISMPDTSTTIKGRKIEFGNEESIVICRDLTNGRLEIQIKGEDEDDNDLDIVYYQNSNTHGFEKKLPISSDNFTLETVRKAIRDVVLHDRNQTQPSVETWLKE